MTEGAYWSPSRRQPARVITRPLPSTSTPPARAATIDLPPSKHSKSPTIGPNQYRNDGSQAKSTTSSSSNSAASLLPAEAWTRIAHFACVDGGLTGSRLLRTSRVVAQGAAPKAYATVTLRGSDPIRAFHRMAKELLLRHRAVEALFISDVPTPSRTGSRDRKPNENTFDENSMRYANTYDPLVQDSFQHLREVLHPAPTTTERTKENEEFRQALSLLLHLIGPNLLHLNLVLSPEMYIPPQVLPRLHLHPHTPAPAPTADLDPSILDVLSLAPLHRLQSLTFRPEYTTILPMIPLRLPYLTDVHLSFSNIASIAPKQCLPYLTALLTNLTRANVTHLTISDMSRGPEMHHALAVYLCDTTRVQIQLLPLVQAPGPQIPGPPGPIAGVPPLGAAMPPALANPIATLTLPYNWPLVYMPSESKENLKALVLVHAPSSIESSGRMGEDEENSTVASLRGLLETARVSDSILGLRVLEHREVEMEMAIEREPGLWFGRVVT
jgi:hypothetical protein